MAQSLGILGDAWDLLIVRDVTRGIRRFDQLAIELGISRKVLTGRLRKLEEHGLLARHAYRQAPVRYEYRLTPRGQALIPVLVALQDWGDRWVLGDGSATGLASPDSAHRMHDLVGTSVPAIELPSTSGSALDLVAAEAKSTILFGYPMTVTGLPPDGWSTIPGASGCTLENRLFRDRYPQFVKRKAVVRGVSTQRPDEQRAFSRGIAAAHFPGRRGAAATPLHPRHRPGSHRPVNSVPVTDIPAAVDWALKACA